jgi:hypothetical protein
MFLKDFMKPGSHPSHLCLFLKIWPLILQRCHIQNIMILEKYKNYLIQRQKYYSECLVSLIQQTEFD